MLKKMNGYVLGAIGLLGIAGYEMVLRLLHPPFLANDFTHGLWIGTCIGLEILSLFVLRRDKH